MHYTIQPCVLRFKQPATTSRGTYLDRKIWYIHLHEGNFHGLGECAPLYDLSCDYCEDMYGQIDKACRSLVDLGRIDYDAWADYPSIVFALETALLSLRGAQRGNNLCLFDNTFTRCETPITINGLVWMGSYDEMVARVEEKLKGGFKCIKIKIGAIAFDRELALLTSLRRRFPTEKLQIRVDANGGFSPVEAREVLERLHELDVHSIEQPIRQHQWAQMARLCRETPVPIALDEELIGINRLEDKQRLLDTVMPQYIILKPTLHGGIYGCEQWIEEARRRNIGFWITSALESNVGLNAISQWAAQTTDCTFPQGLGTGQLFEKNFPLTDLSLEGDKLWFRSEQQRRFEKEVARFENEFRSASSTVEMKTSGSTGRPKKFLAEKSRMISSAEATLSFLGLKKGDTALLCLPMDYVAGKMMVVRSVVGELRLVSVLPSSHPFRTLDFSPVFAALTPMQVAETLTNARETSLMKGVRQLIIGGGSLSPSLEEKLRLFPNNVWSTYGMTETLSHIAMRRVNGGSGERGYKPLPGVEVTLTEDNRLCINAPRVSDEKIVTNDLAELMADGSFFVMGRKDNVVCSGGIKLQIELIERKLSSHTSLPFVLTCVADEKLGEALVLLYREGDDVSTLESVCREVLDRYEVPRRFLPVDALPLTETQKPDRAFAKAIADRILGLNKI